MFERVRLTYELMHAIQLRDWDQSYLMQKATVGVQLDAEERFSVEFGFSRGRESYEDDSVDRWKIGLGMKF